MGIGHHHQPDDGRPVFSTLHLAVAVGICMILSATGVVQQVFGIPLNAVAAVIGGFPILWAAGLGFLGLGAQAPTPEWGAILSNGREYIRTAHHLTTFPGLAILFMVIGFNLVGDGLRDALDPKTR